MVVVIAPDSGRAYLSTYFDDGWLRRLGFLTDADGDGPLVGDLAVLDVPVVRASWTVARARAVRADAPGPAPVARDREGPTAPSEILGAVTAADLDGVADDSSVLEHATPPPPSVGAGERVDAARATLGDADAAWVVRDGRVAGLVLRAALGSPELLAPGD